MPIEIFNNLKEKITAEKILQKKLGGFVRAINKFVKI